MNHASHSGAPPLFNPNYCDPPRCQGNPFLDAATTEQPPKAANSSKRKMLEGVSLDI